MLRATAVAGFLGALLAGAAYIPQIRHLVKERCSAGISRPAFYVWLIASALVTSRALATHATVFILLGAIQIVATSLICFYSKRYEHSFCESHRPAGPDRPFASPVLEAYDSARKTVPAASVQSGRSAS